MKWYERTEHGRQLCRVENFVPFHTGLASLIHDGLLNGVLEQLVGEPVVLFKDKINFKLPGGAGFAPHQDAPAFTGFDHSYHVTVMIAVEPSTLRNGCLEVVTGCHGQGLLPACSDGTLDPAWVAAQRWTPIEMQPGDVLCFDSLVPHRSLPNHSGSSRRALYVTYNLAREHDRRAEYFERKRAAFPPECERAPGVDYSGSAAVYNLGNPIL
jgi:ectoine hydroxylase-related dioxygenase (phytanoyl-CoA dioxygenase family)